MPKEFDKTNTGVLFKNDKEGGNPNWPDYKGSINIEGEEFWLSAWIKEGKKGKFMSLSAKPKDAPTSVKSAPKRSESDDSIPF